MKPKIHKIYKTEDIKIRMQATLVEVEVTTAETESVQEYEIKTKTLIEQEPKQRNQVLASNKNQKLGAI